MNLEELAKEIIDKNNKYFPGWKKIELDSDEMWTKEEVEWLINEMRHVNWTNAISGEAGELSNLSKKHNRNTFDMGGRKIDDKEYHKAVAEELADIFIYVVLYSEVMEIDLPRAIRLKMDENYKKRFKVE